MNFEIGILLGAVFGTVGALILRFYLDKRSLESARARATEILQGARKEAENVLKAGELAAKDEALRKREQVEAELGKKRQELRQVERKLNREEEALARKIGGDLPAGGHVLDDPRLSLGELKALVKRCDLLICNDTGPRHFGQAFGVPVVTVFGPTDPEWTRTSYARERIVRVEVDCGPCQQRLCPVGHLKCMTEVTVEAVEEAACALLPAPAVRA